MYGKYSAYEEEIQYLLGQLRLQSPDVFAATEQTGQQACKPGRLSERHKRLTALGIAVALGSEGAMVLHTKAALRAGAPPDEILETLAVAVHLGGEIAALNATTALAVLKEFSISEQCLLAQLETAAPDVLDRTVAAPRVGSPKE